jgi:hypothetical protein
LFVKEEYYKEISHLGPAEITEQQFEEQIFPTGHVYDEYESDPWESQEEEEEELEDQKKGHFILCPEPVSEQPSPETIQPASAPLPPMLIRDIQPRVRICGADQAACYKFSRIFHPFYEPVSEYMEWHFLHILEPPYLLAHILAKGYCA